MRRALNEVMSVVRKAAIGAGVPVGQAQELAQTATFMAASGDDLAPVLAALAEPEVSVDAAWGGSRLIIKAGTAAMTAPMVKDAFGTGITKVRLLCPAHAPLTCAMLAEAGIEVTCQECFLTYVATRTPARPQGPVEVTDDVWTVLETHAAKTYVPDTDASRSGGAGAGLIDDD